MWEDDGMPRFLQTYKPPTPLNVDQPTSGAIEQKILEGCLIERPGWVRMSIHPKMATNEIKFICDAIEGTASNFLKWKEYYRYNPEKMSLNI